MQRDGNLCKSAGVSPTPPGDGNSSIRFYHKGVSGCIPNPTWGRKLCFRHHAKGACQVYPQPHLGTETSRPARYRSALSEVYPQPHLGTETLLPVSKSAKNTGASPTPPGDGNQGRETTGRTGWLGASPTPPGDGNITAPTNNALEQGASPTPPGDGNPGFLKVTVRVVKMHPQPLTGTEPQTRHRRYRPRLCLLYDWDMSWNTLRNQHIKGKTAGIST